MTASRLSWQNIFDLLMDCNTQNMVLLTVWTTEAYVRNGKNSEDAAFFLRLTFMLNSRGAASGMAAGAKASRRYAAWAVTVVVAATAVAAVTTTTTTTAVADASTNAKNVAAAVFMT